MPNSDSHSKKQSILITGVSSGIGLGITKKLLDHGHRVFGSVRTEEKAKQLEAALGDNFIPLIFDISSEQQIASAQEKLIHSLGQSSLDAIINNAGTAEIGPLLHMPIESFTQHLDILVVGQLRVIQAFHSLLPTANEGTPGRIFNISSISGVWPNPFFGSYSAGKHALEGLSKTLRNELKSFGTKVIVIAPGNISTEIWAKQTTELLEQYKNTAYYDQLHRYLNHIGKNSSENAMTVDEFSDSFCQIFDNQNPKERYTIMKSRKWKYPLSLLFKVKTRTFER